jgi:hypothetical protein
VSDNLVTTPNPTFRCSRCRHIFVLRVKTEADAPQETRESSAFPATTSAKTIQEENRELSFSFPSPEKEKTSKEAEKEIFASGTNREPSSDVTDPTFTIPEEGSFRQKDASSQEGRAFGEIWEISSPSAKTGDVVSQSLENRAISARHCLTFFSVILLIYGLLTWMHQFQPRSIETVLKATPWLGSVVFDDNHLSQGIVLESLQPSFQTISGNREVLVVSGIAVNRNPVSVRQVQVEAYLYNNEGKEIDRQVVWLGSALSRKIIRNLTAQEISILQKLSPAMSFDISPQESATFVIVFLKPKEEIKDFSCRIVSAKEAV